MKGQMTGRESQHKNIPCNCFGDGIGPYREYYCYKDHSPHRGIHCYISIPLGFGINEIRKYAWIAGHWMQEARFVRVKLASGDLMDYSLKSFQKLLRAENADFTVAHHIMYKGPYYTPNWGRHNLTVTRELIPGFLGLGIIRRTGWAHESPKFGDYCYSWRDGSPGIRVLRYSLQTA